MRPHPRGSPARAPPSGGRAGAQRPTTCSASICAACACAMPSRCTWAPASASATCPTSARRRRSTPSAPDSTSPAARATCRSRTTPCASATRHASTCAHRSCAPSAARSSSATTTASRCSPAARTRWSSSTGARRRPPTCGRSSAPSGAWARSAPAGACPRRACRAPRCAVCARTAGSCASCSACTRPAGPSRAARAEAVRRGVALWLVLFAAYAATLGIDATPGERFAPREAHQLLSAESVVSGGFVDLRDEYATRAWRRFSDTPLRPTAAPFRGRLLEPQGVGFALVIAPAYALGGPVLVELWLAALFALAFVLGAALARRLVPEPWASTGALVVGLSPPALVAATAVSPEGAGALAITAAALAALALRDRPRYVVGLVCALALAVAPWLAIELGATAAVCAFALARWLRRRSRPWAAPA